MIHHNYVFAKHYAYNQYLLPIIDIVACTCMHNMALVLAYFYMYIIRTYDNMLYHVP